MNLELLYFDGCEGQDALVSRVRALLAETDIRVDVDVRRVETEEAAQAEREWIRAALAQANQDVRAVGRPGPRAQAQLLHRGRKNGPRANTKAPDGTRGGAAHNDPRPRARRSAGFAG